MYLLKARLSGWGLPLNTEAPEREHLAPRRHWAREKGVIEHSLFGIKETFENASLLAQKYKLTPKGMPASRAIGPHRSKEPRLEFRAPSSLKTKFTGWEFL